MTAVDRAFDYPVSSCVEGTLGTGLDSQGGGGDGALHIFPNVARQHPKVLAAFELDVGATTRVVGEDEGDEALQVRDVLGEQVSVTLDDSMGAAIIEVAADEGDGSWDYPSTTPPYGWSQGAVEPSDSGDLIITGLLAGSLRLSEEEAADSYAELWLGRPGVRTHVVLLVTYQADANAKVMSHIGRVVRARVRPSSAYLTLLGLE